MKKTLLLLILFASLVSLFRNTAVLASEIDDCNDASCFQGLIDKYTSKINETQAKKKTLADEISVADNKIFVTNVKIAADEEIIREKNLKIASASAKINSLALSLDKVATVFVHRIQSTYITGRSDPIVYLLGSADFGEFIKRFETLRVAQKSDKRQMEILAVSQKNYKDQKEAYEEARKQAEQAKAQLEQDKRSLSQIKSAKQALLNVTQNDEARYQQLLSQARAQLSSLSNFTSSLFGGSLIPHQDLSDGFGRYYNQRDSNWGNNLIGYSKETIAAVGCTLTSYAMVVSHYGGSLTPADVAANSGNFSFELFLKPGPSANGHAAESKDNPSLQELRNALSSGAVIIAGLSRDGGPYPKHYSDHWVVLRSVDGNSFRINDPAFPGAMNVLLNDHYSGWTIIESRIYR